LRQLFCREMGCGGAGVARGHPRHVITRFRQILLVEFDVTQLEQGIRHFRTIGKLADDLAECNTCLVVIAGDLVGLAQPVLGIVGKFTGRMVGQQGLEQVQLAGRIAGRCVQLFERIEGDQFVVRGLPLLAVLAWLREAGEMTV